MRLNLEAMTFDFGDTEYELPALRTLMIPIGLFVLVIVLELGLVYLLLFRRQDKKPKQRSSSCKTMVVLGSGPSPDSQQVSP